MMRTVYFLAALIQIVFLYSCGSPAVSRVQPVSVRTVSPEIAMQHEYYASKDSLNILLKFEDVQEVMDVLESGTALEYFVRSGYSAKDQVLAKDSLIIPLRRLKDSEGKLFMSFSLPKKLVTTSNVIHLRLWHALVGQERMAVKFIIPLDKAMLDKKYLVVKASNGLPLFTNYVNTSEKLIIQNYSDAPSKVKAHYFDNGFSPALPPMSVKDNDRAFSLAVSDSLEFNTNDTVRLEKEGVYLLEPSTGYARGILVQNWAFPQITMAKEMLQPLIYITTSAERLDLFQANDIKSAVDNFWLKVGGSMPDARNLIKKFYSRVETANKLYSSHKPGWATDRGMIYIIYGKPSSVSQVGKTYTWIYRESETAPYVKFVFNKKANNFTENHYELVRLREYEESWYNTVAKWRAGITEM